MASLHVEPAANAANWLGWAIPTTAAAAGTAGAYALSILAQVSPDESWLHIFSQVWAQFGLPGVVVALLGYGGVKFAQWFEPFASRFLNGQIDFVSAVAAQGERNEETNRINAETLKTVAESQKLTAEAVHRMSTDVTVIRNSLPARHE